MRYIFHDYLFEWSAPNIGILLLVLLPLLASLFTYSGERTKEQRRILQFAVFAFLMEYVSANQAIAEELLNSTNYPIYHIGTLGLLGFLLSIYYRHIRESYGKWWFWIVLAVLWSICIWNMIWGDGIYSFPSVAAGLYSFTGIVLCISYLYHLLISMSVAKLEEDPLFVATSGFLIYYSGNLLFWIFLTFITADFKIFRSVYSVSAYLTIFLAFMLATAILINSPKEAERSN